MKKFFITFLICIVSICGAFVTGCGGEQYSLDQVNQMYADVLRDYCTVSGYPRLQVDYSKITEDKRNPQADRSVFELLYSKYFKSSYGLIFNVGARKQKILDYTLKKFEQEDLNEVGRTFLQVQNSLKEYNSTKLVYEDSAGNLGYQNLINISNRLIEDFYSLNEAFARGYFKTNKVEFDEYGVKLDDATLRDFMLYKLMEMSKISFNYEVKNMGVAITSQSTYDWFNYQSELVKDFANTSKLITQKLFTEKSYVSEKESLSKIFRQMQLEENAYRIEKNLFYEAMGNINLTKYFSVKNKNSYIENLSSKEQSSYEIMQNFIEGRYNANLKCLNNAAGLLI